MRGSPGADAQRAIDDLHLDATVALPDQISRKTLATVVDGKADAGLRRGVGMSDRGVRKRLRKAVQHRLVGDLAGKPDITRREGSGRTAHQKLAPMRRRARNMR